MIYYSPESTTIHTPILLLSTSACWRSVGPYYLINHNLYLQSSQDSCFVTLDLIHITVVFVLLHYESSYQLLGFLAIADSLREQAKSTVSALHNIGVEVWMATGDNKRTALVIAHSSSLVLQLKTKHLASLLFGSYRWMSYNLYKSSALLLVALLSCCDRWIIIWDPAASAVSTPDLLHLQHTNTITTPLISATCAWLLMMNYTPLFFEVLSADCNIMFWETMFIVPVYGNTYFGGDIAQWALVWSYSLIWNWNNIAEDVIICRFLYIRQVVQAMLRCSWRRCQSMCTFVIWSES
jgi:hypothetical protein